MRLHEWLRQRERQARRLARGEQADATEEPLARITWRPPTSAPEPEPEPAPSAPALPLSAPGDAATPHEPPAGAAPAAARPTRAEERPAGRRAPNSVPVQLELEMVGLPPEAPPPRRVGRTGRSREEFLEELLDPVLSLRDVATMLEVCPTTVRRWANKGLLAHHRTPGRQRRFRLSDVLEFMERQGRSLPSTRRPPPSGR